MNESLLQIFFDSDLEVEEYYLLASGEFWVIEHQEELVGTGAYYPVKRGEKAVEIRKMYLLPIVRGTEIR